MTRRQAYCMAAGHLLALVVLVMPALAQAAPGTTKIKVEGGWTEVQVGWPRYDRDYFVATEKGHHFIELQDLPKTLDSDLSVSLQYYYSYARTRPVLQMIPCRNNIYLVDEKSDDQPNKWLKHNIVVKHEDCVKRNRLAYNVLLHDPGDLFAWSLMEVKSLPKKPEAAEVEPKGNEPSTSPSDLEQQEGGETMQSPSGSGQENGSSEAGPKDEQSKQPTGETIEAPANDEAKSDSDNADEIGNLIDTSIEPSASSESSTGSGQPVEEPTGARPKRKSESELELEKKSADRRDPQDSAGSKAEPAEKRKTEGPAEGESKKGPEADRRPRKRPAPLEPWQKSAPIKEYDLDSGSSPALADMMGNDAIERLFTPRDEAGKLDQAAPAESSTEKLAPDQKLANGESSPVTEPKGIPESRSSEDALEEIESEAKDELESKNESNTEGSAERLTPNQKLADGESSPATEPTSTSESGSSEDALEESESSGSLENATEKDKSENEPAAERKPEAGSANKRTKRWAEDKGKPKTKSAPVLNEKCRPSSCDRKRFNMARFSALVQGLPQTPPGVRLDETRYLVNLKDEPLKLRLDSFELQHYDQVDACLGFELFMGHNTELDLLIEESVLPTKPTTAARDEPKSASSNTTTGILALPAPTKRERLLETIKRKRGLREGNWEALERCVSDYMPHLTSAQVDKNSLKFALKPRHVNSAKGLARGPGQTAILLARAPKSTNVLRAADPILDHLPEFTDLEQVKRHWVIGGPEQRLAGAQVSVEGSGPERVLEVKKIDLSEETFDIRSRWLQIKDAELLKLPVLLVYRLERADWIERIEFQFQRAGDQADEWISHVAYEATALRLTPTSMPPPPLPPLPPKPQEYSQAEGSKEAAEGAERAKVEASKKQEEAERQKEEKAKKEAAEREAANKLLELPIRLKGLDGASQFRLRLRHHVKPSGWADGPSKPASTSRVRVGRGALSIRSLAFADVCAYKPGGYCSNGGRCQSIGAAQARCHCPQGFSGEFCELKNPCQMLYGDRTGEQLCRSVGAQCISALPEMRCEWPNDQFYKCEKLYKLNSTGKLVPGPAEGATGELPNKPDTAASSSGPLEGPEFEALPSVDQVRLLRDALNEGSRRLIIMSVFTAAITIFALVLIGSVVVRLRKSGSRLRQSQNDLAKMTQRAARPSTAAGNGPFASTSFGRVSGARAVGYNNSAFDVE